MGAKNGSLYCTAKFGLRGLSQSLRKDVVGSNIRVCIINPGMVRTSFFDKLKFSPGNKKGLVFLISLSFLQVIKLKIQLV